MKDGTIRRAVTAHDVARLAKVSQAAVSRTFTKGASVSEETRLKVLEAARQLGYRPNLVARSLITRRSSMIGIVVPGLENSFYAVALQTLSSELARHGYRAILFTSPLGMHSDPVLEDVLRYQVDGLVLVSTSLSSAFADECRQMGVPVVLLNRRTQSETASSVTGDNVAGSRRIAEFLLAGGHRRLAFVAGLEDSSTSQEREEGFTRVLHEAGLGAPLRLIGGYTADGAIAATRSLLSSDPPDAIFYANDHMAIAGMNIAHSEFNADIGRTLSIIGFDDTDLAAWPMLSLTTYQQPVREMARRAAIRVVAEIGGTATDMIHDIVPGELVLRKSARRPLTGLFRQMAGETVWSPKDEV